MPINFNIPGRPKKHKAGNAPERTWDEISSGLGDDPIRKNPNVDKKTEEPESSVRFDNMQEVDNAFKKGSLPWPKTIEVSEFRYEYYRSHKKGIVELFQGKKPGYIIYHIPKEHVAAAKQKNMGHWMVFLFKADNSSTLNARGIGFTTAARGNVIYEEQEVIGDVVLLKIALPTGIIALKGKVDTGAEISSLHVDSKPRIAGDTVRFQNHNASGNIITAPLAARQAVKSADGGVEYRPVIELDIEVQGKRVSKAQFNLNDRSHMEHEVLIGQNVLEKAGFLVDPSRNKVQEELEIEDDLYELDEDQLDELMLEMVNLIEEYDNTEED